MSFFRKKTAQTTAPENHRLVASISDTIASAIFQEILRDNEIPFICRQPGAGGYIKILTGGLLSSDSIYVNDSDFARADELYRAYFEADAADGTNGE